MFLLLLGAFFGMLTFEVEAFNWITRVVFGVLATLSLLDQLFEWSRLRIDEKGYSLRGWFQRVEFRKDEVEEFVLKNYMNRDLILVRLTDQAALDRSLENCEIPFPCTFGRPAVEELESLRNTLV
ncbi:MAG: hypothetical protein H8E24_13810 [Verrucomicrobia bacterium]|nr:hypothetical protein [Verrucomicrobiota bacterium]